MHVGGAERAGRDDDVARCRGRRRARGWSGSVHGVVVQARARTAVRPSASAFGADEREGDRDRLVLAHLVDVVVHAQLVVGQRRLVAPAVRQHAVALVGEALVVQGLERPDDRLHVVDVERLVVVLEVDPARLAGDVLLPLAACSAAPTRGAFALKAAMPIASISLFSVMPSCRIASSSAGRPCVSQPKRRCTCLPRMVWKRGKRSFA